MSNPTPNEVVSGKPIGKPKLELTNEILKSLEKFLGRTTLKGHEVPEFTHIMESINQAIRENK